MRVRHEHWQILLDFCEQHPVLITNKFSGADGRMKAQLVWKTVSVKLNSLGFGEKTTEEWKKAFTDWKSKTKTKGSILREERKKTGGGILNTKTLSDLEERLLTLMGQKAVFGDVNQELGFGKVTVQPEIENNDGACTARSIAFSESKVIGDSLIEVVVQNNKLESLLKITDHDYLCTQNINKRKMTESNSKQPKLQRIQSHQRARVTTDLLNINKEALHALNKIADNTTVIAENLQSITTILKKNMTE